MTDATACGTGDAVAMRWAVLALTTLALAGCGCGQVLSQAGLPVHLISSPLHSYCDGRASRSCPTLAEAEDEARTFAADSSRTGHCLFIREESWSGGAKVLIGDGFCHQEMFFDANGRLKMVRTGCEGSLMQYGFGLDPSRPATKTIDFCDAGA